MVPLLVVPFVTELSDSSSTAFLAADWFIWAAFAADFGVKIAVAPRRLEYVKTHPLEAGMVVLPFLRPLRLTRLLRLTRIAVALGVNVDIVRDLMTQRGAKLVVAAVLLCLVFGAGGVFLAERDSPDANINSFGDALWWSATTMTTVGYGDRFPTTPEGRGVAVALMFFGIAALSSLTAVIAATLVREHENLDTDPKFEAVLLELRQLRAEIAELRENLNG